MQEMNKVWVNTSKYAIRMVLPKKGGSDPIIPSADLVLLEIIETTLSA